MNLVGPEEGLAESKLVDDALLVDVVCNLLKEQRRTVEHGDSTVAWLQAPLRHPGRLFGQLDLLLVDRVRRVRRTATHDVHHGWRIRVELAVPGDAVVHHFVVVHRKHLHVPVLVTAQV